MNLQELEKYKDKLDSKTQKTQNGCWWFSGSKNRGRGQITLGKTTKSIRAMAWELHHKQEVDQNYFQIRSSCDNGMCVNPDHLELSRKSWPRKLK